MSDHRICRVCGSEYIAHGNQGHNCTADDLQRAALAFYDVGDMAEYRALQKLAEEKKKEK